MIKRLRLKFIVINMGIATILLSAILGLVFYFTSANLETESIRMMERIASQPFQMDAPGELGEDVRLPFFTLQLGPHGELLDASGGYYDLSDDAFLGGLAQAAAASPRRLGVLEEYNLRYYRSDAPMSRFLVFADISSERATLDGLRRTCLLIGGLSFLAFLWVSVLLSKWAVRPVERAWQQQRQFVAAASHELKTPLTVIMTNAELLQDEADEARRSTFSSSILTMSRQMRALIEQMLELARTDSAESHLVLRPVDLSGLTARSLLPFEPLFFEQGLTLISQVDEGITTICHRAFQGRRALHHIQLPTTLRTIAGLVKPAHGRIHLQGEDITSLSPDRIVSKGLTLVPEGRRVFPDLTVLENLKIGAYLRTDSLEDDLNWVYDLFPRLKERSWQAAGTLSGGEQQMLAVGRALMSRPKIIMMDEPSLGLAPIVVKGIFDIIQEINRQGVTVLLIEQNANMALKIADVGYVLETGRISLTGSGRELLANEAVKKAYLGS